MKLFCFIFWIKLSIQSSKYLVSLVIPSQVLSVLKFLMPNNEFLSLFFFRFTFAIQDYHYGKSLLMKELAISLKLGGYAG